MKIESIRKAFEIEAKAAKLDDNFIEGYPSVMGNMDRGGDVICPGFWRKVLKRFKQHGFITQSHDWSTYMAMPVEAKEDGNRLYSKAEFHSTQDAQDLKTKCRERIEKGLSVGLSVGFGVNYEKRIWFESGAEMWKHIEECPEMDKALFDKASIMAWKGACRLLLPDGCEELYEWAIAPAPMNASALATNVKGQSAKSKATTVAEILQAKIHQSFTIAADELAIRGYMSTEERIALSGNISIALESFRAALDPSVASREIEAGDVDWVASKQFASELGSLAGLSMDDHSETVLAAVKGLAGRLADVKTLRQADGRDLSDARRKEIEELKGLLDSLLVTTPSDRQQSELTAAALKLRADMLRREIPALAS